MKHLIYMKIIPNSFGNQSVLYLNLSNGHLVKEQVVKKMKEFEIAWLSI